MLPQRKPVAPKPPVALGYINRHQLQAGATPESLCACLREWAQEWGFAWGGTYLAQSCDREAVAALTRRAGADPAVEVVVVPDDRHLPAGQREILTPNRRIRVHPAH